MAYLRAWKPTVVIGIDFGMTCTAVSWSIAPDWRDPHHLQRWPGQFHDSEREDKLKTQVAYNVNGVLKSFGFQCDWDDVNMTIIEKEWKPYLDPTFPDDFQGRPTHEDAVKCYTDYMASLWKHLDTYFRAQIPDWDHRSVEILFSIPTTWKSPHLTAQLKGWLRNAGFTNSHNRRIEVSQTEAEAAAVYSAKNSFRVGQIIMVADAGGSTTDVNILEITERTHDRARLKALDKAEGINVGSTLIDGRALLLVKQRLKAQGVICNNDEIHWNAEDMMKVCRFEQIKRAFDGSQTQMHTYMTIPENILPPIYHYPGGRQRVIITAQELQQIFDDQLTCMCNAMDQKLNALTRQSPNPVEYLVLSGGLGSSPYIQKQLRAYYATRYPGMNIVVAPEPQLAVAKGLVMDRVQALKTGSGVYTGKFCRASYGVLCRLPYDRILHRGEKVTQDPLDKMKWTEEQIEWLVREGEAVNESGFRKAFELKITKDEKDRDFEAQFVMSEDPASALPRSMRYGDVQRLCTIKGRFQDEDFGYGNTSKSFKMKKNPFSRKRDHYIAEIYLRVIVGSTDLRFELESSDGRRYNLSEARFEVKWEEATIKPKTTKPSRAMYPA